MTTLYPFNIKKYAGTITQSKKKFSLRYKTQSRLFHIKDFYIKDYNSEDEALHAVREYKKKWAIVNNLVKNKYEIIKDGSIEYIKLYIKPDIYTLIDKDDIDYIDKNIWSFNKGFIKTTDIELNKKLSFHELKYGHNNIFHINGNKLDNRSFNIKLNEDNEKNIIEEHAIAE